MNTLTKLAISAILLGTHVSAQANSLSSELYNEVSSQINTIISTQIEEVKSDTVRAIIERLNEESEKQHIKTNTTKGDNNDK
jgi:hypothetical protein